MTSRLGSATIRRAPLRISFADARGRAVLSEVPATSSSRTLAPPPSPPVPTLRAVAPGNAVRAARVHRRQRDRHSAELWDLGRQPAGQRSDGDGLLRPARPDGARARRRRQLVLSTNDPTGRVLVLTVVPDRTGALRVAVRPSPSAGVVGIGDTFSSGPDEAFHGFGGRHLGLSQRGAAFFNWTDEENVNATSFGVPGAAGGTLLYPNGPQAAYYPQASFISSRRYGFLLDRPELARFRMDSDRAAAWQADIAARRLDYVVAPGPAPTALEALTAITGRQRVPPELGGRARARPRDPARPGCQPVRGPGQAGPRRHRPLPAAGAVLPARGVGDPPVGHGPRPDRRLPPARHPRSAVLPPLRRPRTLPGPRLPGPMPTRSRTGWSPATAPAGRPCSATRSAAVRRSSISRTRRR